MIIRAYKWQTATAISHNSSCRAADFDTRNLLVLEEKGSSWYSRSTQHLLCVPKCMAVVLPLYSLHYFMRKSVFWGAGCWLWEKVGAVQEPILKWGSFLKCILWSHLLRFPVSPWTFSGVSLCFYPDEKEDSGANACEWRAFIAW